MEDDWDYIIVNRIYPLMMQNIAKLSKNQPKVITHAWDDEKPGVAEFVDKWAGILQYIWESPYELNMRLRLIIGLLDCALFGYMVGKTYWEEKSKWDDRSKEWQGDVKETFIHPATFWADPSADSLMMAQNCGTRRMVTLEYAQHRWPKYKKDIEDESFTAASSEYYAGNSITYKDQKGNTLDVPRALEREIVSIIMREGYSKADEVDEDNKQRYVWVKETYFKDYETKHVTVEDNVPVETLVENGIATVEPESGAILKTEDGKPFDEYPRYTSNEFDEPMFPNGRMVMRIGKVILNPKKEDQQYPYKKWPFTIMPYHILPHMWQGCNAVEMSRNNNDMLNLTVSALIRRTMLTAAPERIIEAGALAKDREGKLRQKKPFGIAKYIIAAKGKFDKIRNLEYANIDPVTMPLIQALKQDIDDSMFMQDVARGAAGTSRMTATEAARLDANSHDNTALQAIFLDKFIDETLTLIAEIVQRNYDPGRMTRIISEESGQANATMTPELLDVRFDVNIEPGSTLPFDEERRKQDYMTAYGLFQSPIPNPMLEDMLRILGISNRKKILARYQGLMLFQQFIALSQQVAGGDQMQIQGLVQQVPQLQPLYQLMMQVAQIPGLPAPEQPEQQKSK